MKVLKRLPIILLPALWLAIVPAGSAATLKPYTATYNVITHGIHAGVANFALDKVGQDRWRFKSRSHTTGLVSLFRNDTINQLSIFTVANGDRFLPREYHYSHSGEDGRKQKIIFDWHRNVAHDTYKGEEKTLKIPDGASDPFLAQLKLSRRVAKGMREGRFPVVNRNELDIYHLKVVGSERVTVPKGTFFPIRVERSDPDSTRVTAFWLAPKLNYVPVKVQQIKDGNSVFRLELKSIEFTKRD